MQAIASLHAQSVLILGLGASGLAMACWCQRLGALVTVADSRTAPPQLEQLRALVPQARFISGPLNAGLVEGKGFMAVFRSPGLAPRVFAPVFAAAKVLGIWVAGELGLFIQALRDLRATRNYAPTVLAVTGTNGKTTVTALTGQLVERAGKSVAVAGNIAPAMLDALAKAIDAADLPDVWVLELSSFQLEGVEGFEPQAATVLNISQDHLDWHGDMAQYAAAKARIFGPNTLMVLNRNDPQVMAMLPAPAPAPRRSRGGRMVQRDHISFGLDLPQRAGDFGLEMVNGMAWLVRAQALDDAPAGRRGAQGPAPELGVQRLMPAEALRIRGRHNAANALAALALAQAAGCALGPMLYGLRDYRGEPHRVQPVGVVGDVEYFDDSKGTNVGATVAALRGLGAERAVVVILGGEGKGQDFSPLASAIATHARAVVLIGRDAPLIRAAIAPAGVPMEDASDMTQAVLHASKLAQAGDVVLMSPACASFDMFRDYAHRAEVFTAAVQSLAAERGLALEMPA